MAVFRSPTSTATTSSSGRRASPELCQEAQLLTSALSAVSRSPSGTFAYVRTRTTAPSSRRASAALATSLPFPSTFAPSTTTRSQSLADADADAGGAATSPVRRTVRPARPSCRHMTVSRPPPPPWRRSWDAAQGRTVASGFGRVADGRVSGPGAEHPVAAAVVEQRARRLVPQPDAHHLADDDRVVAARVHR